MDCAIPTAERDALMDIYNDNGGASWTTQTGWNTAADVCTWYGVTCIVGHVTELNLASNNLIGVFDITNGNLNSVTKLYLNNNALTSFSGTSLNALQDLRLYANVLTSFTASGMNSVTQLDLRDNDLTAFVTTGLGSLSYLDLSLNLLTSFSSAGLSTAMNNLNLSGNQLTSFSGEKLTGLTALNLSNNKIASLESSVTTLTNVIANTASL